MWWLFVLCLASSNISKVFCLAFYFLTSFREAWGNSMFSQERKKLMSKRNIYNFFFNFQVCFLLQFPDQKKPTNNQNCTNVFFHVFWLVFVRSWDFFRLTTLLKRRWFLAFASWGFDRFSHPLNPVTDEWDKRHPPGPWGSGGSAPGRHELLALLQCAVHSHQVPHPLAFLPPHFMHPFPHPAPIDWIPDPYSPCLSSPSSPSITICSGFTALRTQTRKKDWEFFLHRMVPLSHHIPAFLSCSSHPLCGKNCSRWRMSHKIKLMWQLK